MEHRERILLKENRSKYDIDSILENLRSVTVGWIGEKKRYYIMTQSVVYGYFQLLLKSTWKGKPT